MMKTNFKKSVVLVLGTLLVSMAAHAGEKFKVIPRVHNGAATIEVEFPNLKDPRFAETPDFKIVNQMEDSPLEWSKLSDEDRLRAANLIYHLTYAKQYFLNVMHSEEVAKLEQITIRINFINDYNRRTHWSDENNNPQYNTSNSIPAGSGFRVKFDDKGEMIEKTPISWNREIFFRPAKPLSVKDILNKLPQDPLNPTIKTARDVIYPTQISTAIQNGFRYLSNTNGSTQIVSSTTHQVGTLAVIEGAFILMKQVNRWLLPNTYYLDAAMVPEVIYHEFSHIALSDYMTPNLGTPVIEGYADYFAAQIAGTPKLAKKLKAYSRGFERDGSKSKNYSLDLENNDQSTSGYVLSLLWGLHDQKKGLGADKTLELVWDARKNLKTYDAEIRNQLSHELRLSCQHLCAHPGNDDMTIIQYFDLRFTNRKY
jgi:hypothetical protein